MRHDRILNLFISSILPKSTSIKIQRKSITTCLGCGKFQLTPRFINNNNNNIGFSKLVTTHHQITQKRNRNTNSNDNNNNGSIPTTTKKYANAHVNSRPAEPSIAISKLSVQGRPNDALGIYLKLLADGGFPSREALYQLTRALYKSSSLVGMYAVHDTLLSFYSHNPPSKRSARAMIYMYTMLIHLIAKTTQPVDMNTIAHLCKEMTQFHDGANIVLYNTLIKTLLSQDQLDNAKALFDDLIERNIQPTIITYGILMKDASRRKDIPRMLTYLDEIEANPTIAPDYAVVSILITTLCDMHEYDRAKDMVEKLHKTVKADDLVGIKFRQQLLRSIEQKRNKNRKENPVL